MPGPADALTFLSDFFAQSSTTTSDNIASAQNRDSTSAAGQSDANTTTAVSGNTMADVGSNPVAALGSDTLTESVTTVSQQLVSDAGGKIATAQLTKGGAPITTVVQDVVSTAMQAVALASTAQVEVLMELARSNARLIVSTIKSKETVRTQLITEIQALNNAVMLLLNSSPFFNAYLLKLQQAYQLIVSADNSLKETAIFLRNFQVYNSITVKRAITTLQQAQTLILPDRKTDVSPIRASQMLLSKLKKGTASQAQAAMMTIPGISLKISRLLLQYSQYTVTINGLLALFLNSLDSFINAYKRNNNIDQITIKHLNAATKQLDALSNDMSKLLFPTPAVKSKPYYSAQTSMAATGWGIRLSVIIQWLKLEPGIGSQELGITGESVKRYNAALGTIYQIVTFHQATAKISIVTEDIPIAKFATVQLTGNTGVPIPTDQTTVTVGTGQEDFKVFPLLLGRLLLLANTAVLTNIAPPLTSALNTASGLSGQPATTPEDVQAKFVQAHSYLTGIGILNARIVEALTPFINTPFELLAGAQKIVKGLQKLLRDLGLDRAADLLGKADFTNFFNMNSKNATYIGAAGAGLAALIAQITSSPDATDQDSQQLMALKTSIDGQTASKQVEAARSGAASSQQYIALQTSDLNALQDQVSTATTIAQKFDSTVTTANPNKVVSGITGQAAANSGSTSLPLGGYPPGNAPNNPGVGGGLANAPRPTIPNVNLGA